MNFKPFICEPIPEFHFHPPPPVPQFPQHEFTMCFIAPPGAGKTTTIMNMIKGFAMKGGYYHRIVYISPSINSDEKFDWLKEQKVLCENKELKAWVKKMEAEKPENEIMPGIKPGWELHGLVKEEAFTGYMKDEDFFDSLDDAESEFRRIMQEQKDTINLLKKYGQPKTLADRLLVVLDDQVGSKMLKSKYFTGVITRHRHHGASIMIASQGYKEIAKTVRTACISAIFFEIGNRQEIAVIMEEFGMGLTKEAWLEIYEEATREEHSFMFIDYKKKKGRRIMQSFEYVLEYTPEDDQFETKLKNKMKKLGHADDGEEVVEEPAKKKRRKNKV